MSWRWNSLRHRIQDHSLRPRTGICKITCIIIQWISRSLNSSLPVGYSMLKSKDFSIFGSFSPNGTRECSNSIHWINEEKSATLSSTEGLFTNSYQMHTDIVTSYIRLRSKEISFPLMSIDETGFDSSMNAFRKNLPREYPPLFMYGKGPGTGT
jgi:hypothetical protein